MGWFNTILDVASLSMEVAQVNKLEKMRKQGATSALVQSILQELRNQIFNYKQAAQVIVEAESKSTIQAAGAMRILELRLNESAITTDLFPDLNDKEYVAGTYKFIKENGSRMLSQLSTAEVSEVDSVASAALQLPQYRYYLDNYQNYNQYKEAKSAFETAGPFASPGSRFGIGCGLAIGALILSVMFGSLFKDGMAGIIIGLVALLGAAFWVNGKAGRGKEAKKQMDELSKKVNLEFMEKFDREMGEDQGKVNKTCEEAEEKVKNFFGSSPLLPV